MTFYYEQIKSLTFSQPDDLSIYILHNLTKGFGCRLFNFCAKSCNCIARMF